MAQITITLDLTPETLEVLRLLTPMASEVKPGGVEPEAEQLTFDDIKAEKDKKPAKKSAAKNKKTPTSEEGPESESENETPAVSLTDVRAVALKLSKAGKQKQLKEIFAKYGAEKLSDISAERYSELLVDLEEANG